MTSIQLNETPAGSHPLDMLEQAGEDNGWHFERAGEINAWTPWDLMRH